jgi:hypothetical protein
MVCTVALEFNPSESIGCCSADKLGLCIFQIQLASNTFAG